MDWLLNLCISCAAECEVGTTIASSTRMHGLAAKVEHSSIVERFLETRRVSEQICEVLPSEVYRLQPAPFVSPPWWNLGHTSWFFVENLLRPFGGTLHPSDDEFRYILNSYYAIHGDRLPREKRGLLPYPTTDHIYSYRASVDERVVACLTDLEEGIHWEEACRLVEIGIQHEQQHQELFFTEIKFILGGVPPALRVPYNSPFDRQVLEPRDREFLRFSPGLCEIGADKHGFAYDNELPRHQIFLTPFEIDSRLVTQGEFQEFIDDSGYQNEILWLSNGWERKTGENWTAPLYWDFPNEVWTLGGFKKRDPALPVGHVSFYEADAFAKWKSENYNAFKGVRLPTEAEWEHASQSIDLELSGRNFLESRELHPSSNEMFGVLWQWTRSHYEPYPGYKPFGNGLQEYNAKFMDNQRVLRGGSVATPFSHFRKSYRNYWEPGTRFQFTGIRLARDCDD